MSRRKPAPSSQSWRCDVICRDGHERTKVDALAFDETTRKAMLAIGPRSNQMNVRQFGRIYPPGTTFPRTARTDRWGVGAAKVRLLCDRCGLDVPVSWPHLHELTGRLFDGGVSSVELNTLAAMIDGSSA